jgi:hypothetical protein
MTRHIARMLFGMIILVIASQATMAQTTTLVCRWDTSQSFLAEDQPSTVELNEAQHSVVIHLSAETMAGTLSGGRIPAHSVGPLPATFTADTISFSDRQSELDWTINRLTGVLVNSANWRWTCQAGKRQF